MKAQRLFFAMNLQAPWPTVWPKGRLLQEKDRHTTLAFLESARYEEIEKLLPMFPALPFKVAPCGRFDECLLLPEQEPHVVAWHIEWFEKSVFAFQNTLVTWLKEHGCSISSTPYLPHVTLCRGPFDEAAWKESFQPLPCYAEAIHLFESLGHSTYRSLWSLPLAPPFEEIEHVADIAFYIYGTDVYQLYRNAGLALSFKCPFFLTYVGERREVQTIEDIVIALNEAVSDTDRLFGCPFKAVSFHGEIERLDSKNLLRWEMIVDV